MKIIPQCDKVQASFVFPLNQHESKQQDVQFHVCFVQIGNRPHHCPECTKLGLLPSFKTQVLLYETYGSSTISRNIEIIAHQNSENSTKEIHIKRHPVVSLDKFSLIQPFQKEFGSFFGTWICTQFCSEESWSVLVLKICIRIPSLYQQDRDHKIYGL